MRFVFRGILEAENIDHAMATLAYDLIKTLAEEQAGETGEAGTVHEVTMEADE